MVGRSGAGQDGWYGGRRGLRGRMRDWMRRHPFMTLLGGVAVLGWITWWEAARIEGARSTVAHGWGTGLAAGILASLGLTILWAITLLATRRRPTLRTRMQWPLALVLVISWGICLRTTAPSSSSGGAPYVITTGIGVGEIAYVATYSAYFIALLLWAGLRLWRRARIS